MCVDIERWLKKKPVTRNAFFWRDWMSPLKPSRCTSKHTKLSAFSSAPDFCPVTKIQLQQWTWHCSQSTRCACSVDIHCSALMYISAVLQIFHVHCPKIRLCKSSQFGYPHIIEFPTFTFLAQLSPVRWLPPAT